MNTIFYMCNDYTSERREYILNIERHPTIELTDEEIRRRAYSSPVPIKLDMPIVEEEMRQGKKDAAKKNGRGTFKKSTV